MKHNAILVIEDDAKLLDAISTTLSLANYEVYQASNVRQALQLISETPLQLIFCDVNFGQQSSGLVLLEKMQTQGIDVPTIMMTAYASIHDAVQAIKLGAKDYLVKPFSIETITQVANQYIHQENTNQVDLIAENLQMKQLLKLAKKVAVSDANVLIHGESGTGKEVIAKYIHQHSDYSHGPFIAVNCAAIPENMLEAILFGYEKGAFTGAYQASPGKFELAQNGTLFLDEIAEMPLSLQAKLLRVIQEREVERLGGKKLIKLQLRILAATNKDLALYVQEKKFREDLFFRLNVFPLSLPPLRNRTEDIIPLANYILQNIASKMHRALPKLDDSAINYLLEQKWVGNIRELENSLQRVLIIQSNDVLRQQDFEFPFQGSQTFGPTSGKQLNAKQLHDTLKNNEYQIIIDKLNQYSGNRQDTAKALGISNRTLRYKLAKMKKEGIEVPGIKQSTQGVGDE